MKNMSYLLDSYLNCSAYENVVFGWVLHREEMTAHVLSMIKNADYSLHRFSLVCSESVLIERLQKDVDAGVRKNVSWNHALETRPNFDKMDTIKIEVDDMTPERAADTIYNVICPEEKSCRGNAP